MQLHRREPTPITNTVVRCERDPYPCFSLSANTEHASCHVYIIYLHLQDVINQVQPGR